MKWTKLLAVTVFVMANAACASSQNRCDIVSTTAADISPSACKAHGDTCYHGYECCTGECDYEMELCH